MDGTLKLLNNTLAFADVGADSNPMRRFFDWRANRSYAVKNPTGIPHAVDPGASLNLFSGVRSLSTDGTTALRLDLSPLASTRYRFTWTGGTDPVLRQARALILSGRNVVVVVNSNLSVTFTTQAGDFGVVQVGDVIFIPDTTTGDAAAPFNPLNTGYWSVLAVDGAGAWVQLARPTGAGFLAYPETVAVTANAQVLAYGAAGVQVGDSVNLSAGFTAPVQGAYQIVAVTSKWFEVVATQPLPSAISATPGAAGFQVYTSAKRYVRFEADQSCCIRLNGDTGNSNQLTPWAPADPDQTASYEKVGPCWSATVVNLSSQSLNILFLSAE